jgi:hypothetical protein
MKRLILYYFLFIATVGLISSCKTLLAPKDYVRWIENPDNGLRQKKDVNGVVFDLQYKPADYVIARENAKNTLPLSFYNERKEKLGELLYFSLEIKSASQDLLMYDLKEEQEYYRRVNYYSLDFQQDIKLVVGADTLPCLMYQFENTYGTAPYIRMSIAFSGKQREKIESSDCAVLLEDRVFGGGLLRYEYQKNKWQSVPAVETK